LKSVILSLFILFSISASAQNISTMEVNRQLGKIERQIKYTIFNTAYRVKVAAPFVLMKMGKRLKNKLTPKIPQKYRQEFNEFMYNFERVHHALEQKNDELYKIAVMDLKKGVHKMENLSFRKIVSPYVNRIEDSLDYARGKKESNPIEDLSLIVLYFFDYAYIDQETNTLKMKNSLSHNFKCFYNSFSRLFTEVERIKDCE